MLPEAAKGFVNGTIVIELPNNLTRADVEKGLGKSTHWGIAAIFGLKRNVGS